MTKDELMKHFSSPEYEEDLPYIRKIMEERPDVEDERIISIASSFMLDAEDERVSLSVPDALRLANAFRSRPVSELSAELRESGISDAEKLLEVLNRAEDLSGIKPAPMPGSIKQRAKKLEELAGRLSENKDIILLGLPVFWPGFDCVWVKLAVMGGTLTEEEQRLIIAMRDISDNVETSVTNGIYRLLFRIFGTN